VTSPRPIALAVLLVGLAGGCAPKVAPVPPAAMAPRYPDFPSPDIPASLQTSPILRERHGMAWRRLQSGDPRAANREFTAILEEAPAFYPSQTGLGFALLADRQFKAADASFAAALAGSDRYLPALTGQVESSLALNNLSGAIGAMERILTLDPKRDALRSRLDLVKFRQVQTLIDTGRRARLARRYEEARVALGGALVLAPTSAIILRELALNDLADGELVGAEAHARRAVQLDGAEADAHAILATVLQARERWRDAAAEWDRAVGLESRPEWRGKSAELRDRADKAGLPAEYRALPTATTVSRALAAAYLGIKLEALLDMAPRRPAGVATDIRSHWASTWILQVTQTGVMEILPNHTFQPGSTVRRGELAQIVGRLVALVADRPGELATWRAARPRLSDLPAANVFYKPAAFAIASGAMAAVGFRFEATRPATGEELISAIARVEQLARR
jgi:tetratricopeptide (TPR) repeat protein